MKNRKKDTLLKCLISISLILFVVVTIISLNQNPPMKITQLSDNGPRQMMGYILKTKNNKLIVIDGGTTDDTDNLIKNINDNGKKVDYWFITHAHDDHAGAFTQIVNDTDIQIDNIYISLNDFSWYETNEPNRTEFSKELIGKFNII